MKKTLQHFLFGTVCAAILAAGTANAQPKPASTDAKSATEEKPKRDWYPFYGTVANVDAKAKTVSLRKLEGVRVLQTDDKTTLEKAGKPAKLADVKTGNYLHGKLHKEGGKEEYILDAKIELEPPAAHSKATNKLEKARSTVMPAAPAPEETTTNAPAKKKKKAVTTPQ